MRPEEISEYVQGIREVIKDYERRISTLEDKVSYLENRLRDFTEPFEEDEDDLYSIAERYGFDDPMDMGYADNM